MAAGVRCLEDHVNDLSENRWMEPRTSGGDRPGGLSYKAVSGLFQAGDAEQGELDFIG